LLLRYLKKIFYNSVAELRKLKKLSNLLFDNILNPCLRLQETAAKV
jgi:hypothetical protein